LASRAAAYLARRLARAMEAPLIENDRGGDGGGTAARSLNFVAFLWRLNDIYMTGGIFGSVKGPFTVRQCINLHKLLVAPVYLLLIHWYGGDLSLSQRWGPAAAVLLAAHSSYGVFWVYKDIWFPDSGWQIAQNLLGFVLVFVYPLGAYYLPMFCLVSRQCPLGYFSDGSEPWVLAIGLWFYIIGFFYHFCGDISKDVQLKYQQPRHLIASGLMAHTRNPNYFGEVFNYLGLAILSTSWFCIPVFMLVWVQIFLPNMLGKEVSLARYEEWEAWYSRTGFLFPYVPSLMSDFCRNALSRLPHVD